MSNQFSEFRKNIPPIILIIVENGKFMVLEVFCSFATINSGINDGLVKVSTFLGGWGVFATEMYEFNADVRQRKGNL